MIKGHGVTPDYENHLVYLSNLIKMSLGLFEHINKDLKDVFVSGLGNEIYYVTHRGRFMSPYISKRALELKHARRCNEHAFGRKWSAKLLLKLCFDGKIDHIDIEQLDTFLRKYCFQNKTTREENIELRYENKKNPNADWRVTYKKLGIVLCVKRKNKNGKFVFKPVPFDELKKYPLLQKVA